MKHLPQLSTINLKKNQNFLIMQKTIKNKSKRLVKIITNSQTKTSLTHNYKNFRKIYSFKKNLELNYKARAKSKES